MNQSTLAVILLNFPLIFAAITSSISSIYRKEWNLLTMIEEKYKMGLSTTDSDFMLNITSKEIDFQFPAQTIFPKLKISSDAFFYIKFLPTSTAFTILKIQDPFNNVRLHIRGYQQLGQFKQFRLNILYRPIFKKENAFTNGSEITVPFLNAMWTLGILIENEKITVYTSCDDVSKTFGYHQVINTAPINLPFFDSGATLFLLNNGEINGNKEKFEGTVSEFVLTYKRNVNEYMCRKEDIFEGSGSETMKWQPKYIGNYVITESTTEKTTLSTSTTITPTTTQTTSISTAASQSTITTTQSKEIKRSTTSTTEQPTTTTKQSTTTTKKPTTTKLTTSTSTYPTTTTKQSTTKTKRPTTTKKSVTSTYPTTTTMQSATTTKKPPILTKSTDTTKLMTTTKSTTTTKESTSSTIEKTTTTVKKPTTSKLSTSTKPTTITESTTSTTKKPTTTTTQSTMTTKTPTTSKLTTSTKPTTFTKSTTSTTKKPTTTTTQSTTTTKKPKTITKSTTSMTSKESTIKTTESTSSTTEKPTTTTKKPTTTSKVTTSRQPTITESTVSTTEQPATTTSEQTTTTKEPKSSTTSITSTQSTTTTKEPTRTLISTTTTTPPTKYSILSCKGSKGDKGEKGIPGLNGSDCECLSNLRLNIPQKGNKGEKGEFGQKGERGSKGVTGNTGICSESQCNALPPIKGSKGDRGEIGYCSADSCKVKIISDKGEKGIKGDQGIKGDNGDNLKISDILMILLPEIKSTIEDYVSRNVMNVKGEPGSCTCPVDMTREEGKVKTQTIILNDGKILKSLSVNMPVGQMVFLIVENILLVKIDDVKNRWRIVKLENSESDWYFATDTQNSQILMPTTGPISAMFNTAFKLMLIALPKPTGGDLRSDPFEPGAYSGSSYLCQKQAYNYGLGRAFYPLLNTDMYDLNYLLPEKYRYGIPVINRRNEKIAQSFADLLKPTTEMQAGILDFRGDSVMSENNEPCVWIGEKPSLHEDKSPTEEGLCLNWMSKSSKNSATVTILKADKPLLNPEQIKSKSCDTMCYILCMQIYPLMSEVRKQ